MKVILINKRNLDENHGTGASKNKDLLIVKEGTMTISRAKKVKKAMGLVVQATTDEHRSQQVK